MATLGMNKNSYLTFKLGNRFYAVNVNRVVNIIELSRITKLPSVPDYILGVINIRGMVLPVIDTGLRFNLPQSEFTVNTCILALDIENENGQITVGALVDSVYEVVDIEPDLIIRNDETLNKYKINFVSGKFITSLNDEINIIDIDLVFSVHDFSLLAKTEI